MMHGLVLFLVLTSIGTGFFSPRAEKNGISNNDKREDLIIKEANRVIMVEYEREARPHDQSSIPSSSSSFEDKLSKASDIIESSKEKFKEASSVLPNLGQGVSVSDDSSTSSSNGNDHQQHHYSAKELICDAYGKCKHKLAGVFGKTKEATVRKVHDVEDMEETVTGKAKKAYDMAKENMEGVEEKTKEAVEKTKEDVFETGQKAMGKAKEGWGKAKETGGMTMEVSKEGLTKAGEGVSNLAHDVTEIKKNAAKKVLKAAGVPEGKLSNAEEELTEFAHDVIDKKKRAGKKAIEAGEVAVGKTKEAMGKAKESVSEKGNKFKEFVAEKVQELEETGGMAMDKATETFTKTGESVREKALEMKEKTKDAEEKVKENMEIIKEDVKKGHNSIWDHRSIETKAGGLFKEGGMNFSIIYGKGREAMFYAAKHAVSAEFIQPTLASVHLLGLATAYGLSVWVTFVSSYILAGTLPRQQFGIVQSKIYPVYFKALLGSIGCSLVAHVLRHPLWGLDTFQAYNMFTCLGLVLFNLLYLEPRATKVMFDKMKLEKEEGRGTTAEQQQVGEPAVSTTAPSTAPGVGVTETGVTGITEARVTEEPSRGRVEKPEEVLSQLRELNKRLKKLNAISSLLNVITLMSVTWQLVNLGRGLSVA